MDEKMLDRLCREAGKKNRPLLARGSDIVELTWSEPPRPQASFGLVNDWAEVSSPGKGSETRLLIPFQPKQLGWVKQETLQLFRFDPRKKSFKKVGDALLHPKYPVMHATVNRAGIYGLIGLHSHPLVQETIRILCESRPMLQGLPKEAQSAFRDRMYDAILCAPDMDKFWESRDELIGLAKNLGMDLSETGLPANLPPSLPRLAQLGESICDRCHGIDLEDFLDCQVMEPLPQRPCEQATWENVGPKHISGAIRQVIVDPTDRRRLYAVAANGGIWRLDNVDDYPNTQWGPFTDGLTNLRFRTMTIAPGNSRVMYAANSTKTWPFSADTVFSEIYRSGNFGRSWDPVHKTGMGVVHRLVVHPANPDVVFAATSTGLWLQSDVVGSWTNLFPEKDCLDVALDPDDSSIVYLGVRGLGLFKSFTSGATWPAVPHLVFNPTTTSDDPTTPAVESNTRQTIKISLGRRNKDGTKQTPLSRRVVVRFGNQINVHDKGGDDPAGWLQAVPSRIVSNPNPPPPTIDRSKENLEGGGSRRSDTFPAQSNEWINCLAVDPFDPDHIFVGSVGVLESSNGGQDWTVRGSIAHEDNHSIVFDETDEGKGLVYLANDGGIFSSGDGGATWPTMSLTDTERPLWQGTNLAQGLITSEFRHSAVRSGSCLAAIDHTGFIFSDDFDSRWQFLFNEPDVSARHGLEQSYVFSCPASQDRYYIIDRQGTTALNANRDKLVQFDFTRRTDGLVNKPDFIRLSETQVAFPPIGSYFPEEQIYLRYLPGPFAARFREEERLLLFAAVNQPGVGFTIQSLRLEQNGTAVIEEKTEATNPSEAFSAITFVPTNTQVAFAITLSGELFERDFSDTDQFRSLGRWDFPANDFFVSRLVAVPRPALSLYALSQHGIGRFDYRRKRWSPLYTESRPNEMLLSLAAHPTRDRTMFLGTNRGVYLSEDGGSTWQPYRQSMPRVPITELSFDQGYLYAATLGRGLWRCRPCLG